MEDSLKLLLLAFAAIVFLFLFLSFHRSASSWSHKRKRRRKREVEERTVDRDARQEPGPALREIVARMQSDEGKAAPAAPAAPRQRVTESRKLYAVADAAASVVEAWHENRLSEEHVARLESELKNLVE